MSWNQPTPQPPMSPRRPKIQQQSWDGTPTIKLYDPSRNFYESSPNMPSASGSVKKNPATQVRKTNYSKYCLPSNPMHQMSDPGTYYNMTPTGGSKSPNSPSQTFEFELTPQHSARLPLKSVTASNRRFFEDTSADTLQSPKKYEFSAVSPKFDNPGTCEARRSAPIASLGKFIQIRLPLRGLKSFVRFLFFVWLQASRNLNIASRQRRRLMLRSRA
jgi:hypothetical protein